MRRSRTHRSLRRGVKQALGSHAGPADERSAEEAQVSVSKVRLKPFSIWQPLNLKDHLADRRRYRAHEAGRVFFSGSYNPKRHKRRFLRFLEAVFARGVAPSRELAERFQMLLDPSRPVGNDSHFLKAFLDDNPNVRARLEVWIADVLSTHRDP